MKNYNPKNRYDFSVIEQWVSPNARVLDLGCGDGMLLNYLSTHKNTTGFGIEKNKDNWLLSLKNGLDVIQMDLESGLAGFEDNSFDFIVSYGYRHILSKNILDLLPNKIINLHISYLPYNRGADPNFWSFMGHCCQYNSRLWPKILSINYER